MLHALLQTAYLQSFCARNVRFNHFIGIHWRLSEGWYLSRPSPVPTPPSSHPVASRHRFPTKFTTNAPTLDAGHCLIGQTIHSSAHGVEALGTYVDRTSPCLPTWRDHPSASFGAFSNVKACDGSSILESTENAPHLMAGLQETSRSYGNAQALSHRRVLARSCTSAPCGSNQIHQVGQAKFYQIWRIATPEGCLLVVFITKS